LPARPHVSAEAGWIRNSRRARATLLTLAVLAAVPAAAQTPLADRPGPTALVLSTGASRGFSHAGVLAALDSLGYDPDIVVGSSMGAILGALYASGYEPADIWKMVLGTDWSAVFMTPGLVLGPDRRVHTPALGLGVNLAPFEVSRGFISDRRVNQLLVHLLFAPAAAARSDFDRLPRRFRAIVADIENGAEITIAKGDLARAVRASMGTPGFFSPIEWEGRLVADGGLANYLPISIARSLGATYIVASKPSR
jgi:NTE family protein